MKYKGQTAKEISFPLGGIGTGCIGLGGDGRLIDWEIFNNANKGSINGHSHFAIRAIDDGKITAAVLNGDILKDYMGQYSKGFYYGYGFGPNFEKMYGFPHFKDVEFNGEYPVATIDFKDEKFPADVKMTAFNPFIPGDSENSSIPAAFFEIEVENTTDKELKYQIALTAANPYEKSINKSSKKDGISLVTMYNSGAEKDTVGYGDLTIATDADITYLQTYWYRGQWRDNIVTFWNEFSGDPVLEDRQYDCEGKNDRGTVAAEITVAAGEKKKARFIISWNSPVVRWYNDGTWKNYYATVYEDSSASAIYALKNWDSLYSRTEMFTKELHSSTLPECVIDAASANLSVLKSPTVLRLEDGSFYGWEGLQETDGSCEGTCQHVWNYAYALCFLFPDLERSLRENEFKYSTEPNGKMGFRMMLPPGTPVWKERACLDGQMGSVIKWYREWKISGDNKWLKDNWENIKNILEYAWSESNPDKWDFDKDGVLEGRQHHTLDLELFGPSSWLEGMYLAALKAASEMAEFLGDVQKAEEYREVFEKGYKWTKENLFNGKYFMHKVDIRDKSIVEKFDAVDLYWNDEVKQIKYQVYEGSSVDQVLGQWHADILGLGEIFDKEQLSIALESMMKNNFKPSMRYFTNPWRIYSVGDEAGTVICDYPEGAEKPKIPISYCEETMTGFEYSFAGLLCSQGKIDDGLTAVKAVRDRFNGEKRNPWNEFECGSNYARAMASYSLIPILSGFEFDLPHFHIGFKPYKKGDFKCIWSVEKGWGNFEICGNTAKINVVEGEITLETVGASFCDNVKNVKIDGKTVDFEFKNGKIYFEKTNIFDCVEFTV